MKLQINLRNGQYITTECTQDEYDVFVKSLKGDLFGLVDIPGTKYDMVSSSDISYVIELHKIEINPQVI